MSNPITTYTLNEPLLRMSALARFFVRLVEYATYTLLFVFCVAALFSDVTRLYAAGWLLLLFLGDRLLHIGEAEKTFTHLLPAMVCLEEYIPPTTLGILEYGVRRASTVSGSLSLYLLERLLTRNDVRAVFARMSVPLSSFEERLAALIVSRRAVPTLALDATTEYLRSVLAAAFEVGVPSNSFSIEPRDLLAGLFIAGDADIAQLFGAYDVRAEDLRDAVLFSIAARRRSWWWRPRTITNLVHGPYKTQRRVMNRAWTARPTPTLDRFSEDLTDFARAESVGFMVGHDMEYARMLDVLSRPTNPNVLLVGETGIGRETIIAHLAFEMTKDRVPAPLFDRRLVSLKLGLLLAGADVAELRNRVQTVIDEIIMAGNIILAIPDIHNLVKTSGPAAVSAIDILLPAIQSDAFSVIGTSYPREFKQYIESQSDFAGSFEVIRVAEITESEATRVLIYQSLLLEQDYNVTVSFAAIKKAVQIAHQHFRASPLPSSAEGLLKEALADVVSRRATTLSIDDIILVAERKVNIPLRAAGGAEAATLLNLESIIHERYVDQEEAVTAVSRALREYRSGLSRKGGPIASFLFVGPTGVGKTELAKILAKLQFGSTDAMVRFDMSEFQDKQSFFRFIGSPDGSISGALTDAILQKPYSLVLLDEFEKSHPDILNLFLQVLDDGRLTDNLSRLVSFEHTIIIATSNAAGVFIKTSIEAGMTMPQLSDELKKKLVEYFRPELINRFSGIIVFKTLLPAHILQIARFQLKDLAAIAKEAQGIDLSFDDSAVAEIARLGFDPVFGARPLRGVISEKLRSVLAEKILRKEFGRGARVRASFANNQFTFLLL